MAEARWRMTSRFTARRTGPARRRSHRDWWDSRLGCPGPARRRSHHSHRARLRLAVKWIGGVLLLVALASPAHALPTMFGDIAITPEPEPKGVSSHGYFEYIFQVVNKSTERSHIISLSIPFEKSFFNGDSIRELRRTVEVRANETVRISLLQPDHPPIGGTDVAVTIDGRQQEYGVRLKPNESLRRSHSYRGSYVVPSGPVEPLILLGTRVKPLPMIDPTPEIDPSGMRGTSAIPPGMRGPGGVSPPPPPGRRGSATRPATPAAVPAAPQRLSPVEVLGGWLSPALMLTGPYCMGAASRVMLAWQLGEIEKPPGKPGLPARGFQFVNAETWSTNWLAYTRYDGIIVTAAELNTVPEGIRTALWQYVETGGALLVLGRVDLRGLSALTETKEDQEGWLSVRAGFGVCQLSPDANYDGWGDDRFAQLMNDWRSTAAVWSSAQRNTLNANQDFPVVEDLGIPIKGLFLLMFLFTLGIGPINILVLTRLKRRIWLLWTTPVLSLFTCLAVFGYMLLSEGWSGQLRSDTLTLLDETTHRATTIGWTGIYSPLTPSDGLHFSRETEVAPQRYYEGRDGGARSCTIDWSQDQHFVSGWVEARIPAHFKVRKSELRRERVALQREPDGRWSMVNGLSKDIHRFWFADAKGQLHTAKNVAPGAKTMLTLTEKETLASTTNVKDVFLTNWVAKIKDLAEHPQHYLRPGLYLAELEDSPFLEDALPNARTRKLHALVVGIPPTSPER